MKKKIAYILASYFGFGFSPFASGTVGSLMTLPLAFVCAYYWGVQGIIVVSVVAFVVGVIASKEVLKYTKHDPSLIVIDEVAGQSLTVVLLADKLTDNMNAWLVYVVGFGFFRLFDIWKPQPVRWADRKVLNAWGVMLDDIFAGIYAAVCLYLVNRYFPLF